MGEQNWWNGNTPICLKQMGQESNGNDDIAKKWVKCRLKNRVFTEKWTYANWEMGYSLPGYGQIYMTWLAICLPVRASTGFET